MTYEDEGGAPINQEEQIEEATMKVESRLESMGDTIRDLLEALEYAEKEISLIYDTAKNGHTDLEVTIGQWGRLGRMQATIKRAKP